nr:permease [Pseudodesulfovibrio sp.]
MSQNSIFPFSLPSMAVMRPWLFPLGVSLLYGLGFLLEPENTEHSLHICVDMFQQLTLPMLFAVVMMVVFNRFLSPAVVARFLGRSAGAKGVVLSSLAGILSMGPVYAWYPLFKTLRDKGASVFHVANFVGCRSIKPALLPIVVSSFGWRFTILFLLMSFAIALSVACIVSLVCTDHEKKESVR